MLAAAHRPDEAIDAYGRVIVLQPDYADARLNRAILLCERGDLAPARDEIMSAILDQPNDARMLCTQGLIEMRMGYSDAACAAFTRSIETDPALADPWANRATIAYRRGDVSGALRDLTEALARREDTAILCNRARVFEAARRWQEVLDQARDVLDLEIPDLEQVDASDLQTAESDVADARAWHVGDRKNPPPARQIARDDRLLGAGVENELEWRAAVDLQADEHLVFLDANRHRPTCDGLADMSIGWRPLNESRKRISARVHIAFSLRSWLGSRLT